MKQTRDTDTNIFSSMHRTSTSHSRTPPKKACQCHMKQTGDTNNIIFSSIHNERQHHTSEPWTPLNPTKLPGALGCRQQLSAHVPPLRFLNCPSNSCVFVDRCRNWSWFGVAADPDPCWFWCRNWSTFGVANDPLALEGFCPQTIFVCLRPAP